MDRVPKRIEAPHAFDAKPRDRLGGIDAIGKDMQFSPAVALDRARQMVAVFVQVPTAGRERRDQANLHESTCFVGCTAPESCWGAKRGVARESVVRIGRPGSTGLFRERTTRAAFPTF